MLLICDYIQFNNPNTTQARCQKSCREQSCMAGTKYVWKKGWLNIEQRRGVWMDYPHYRRMDRGVEEGGKSRWVMRDGSMWRRNERRWWTVACVFFIDYPLIGPCNMMSSSECCCIYSVAACVHGEHRAALACMCVQHPTFFSPSLSFPHVNGLNKSFLIEPWSHSPPNSSKRPRWHSAHRCACDLLDQLFFCDCCDGKKFNLLTDTNWIRLRRKTF